MTPLRARGFVGLRPFHSIINTACKPLCLPASISSSSSLSSPPLTLAIRSAAVSRPKPFSTTTLRYSSDSHESHYEPPSGWLFGVKPGEKYVNEGWETIWYWGFFGSLGLAVVAYAFKPDTSIQTWALEEARRRLEAEGILEEPDDKP